MLDLRPLRHFIAIVDLGSLSRAAEFVYTAQPALSQQVAALEAELGVKLLHRSFQGTVPTEAGKVLYRHARLVLQQLDQLRKVVRASSDEVIGRVSIGLSITTAEILCVPLLTALRQSSPSIQQEVTALPNRLLREMLINGRMDVVMLFDQPKVKGIKPQRVATEELFFIGRSDQPGQESPITIAELAQHDLLLPCSPHGVRLILEAALMRAGLEYTVVAELDSVPTLMEAVQSGLGMTVMPWSAVHRYAEGLSVRPFAPPLTREIMLCTSDSEPYTEAIATVVNTIVDLTGQLVASGRWRGLVV